MASAPLRTEFSRQTSTISVLSPLEYFTDSSNISNTKADLILVVDNAKFYCHRLLLSLISPVFTRMFEGQFKEHDEQEIVLEGKKSESILELLKYIYPQFHGEITNENVEDFLQLADEYMIEHIKNPCEEVLRKQLEKFKFVSLPIQQKLEQPSGNSKHLHASNTSLHSPRTTDDHASGSASSGPTTTSSARLPSTRRTPSTRHPSTKIPSSYLKSTDKSSGSSTTHPRYVLFLDRTRMPTFFDADNGRLPFVQDDVEMWLRRLRILYQIHRGKNYGQILDSIVSILQFIPSTILFPLVHIKAESFATDETMLNDIARARMFLLEEWAADGESYRPVVLTESYRMMSPNALVTAETTPVPPPLPQPTEEEIVSIETIMTTSTSSDEVEMTE